MYSSDNDDNAADLDRTTPTSPHSAEIYQRILADLDHTSSPPHSNAEYYQRINSSLLDADRDQQSSDSDQMNQFSSMWGLNTPRGPFLGHSPNLSHGGHSLSFSNTSLPQSPVGFGRRKFITSTPFPNNYHYKSEDDIAASPTPLRSFNRHFSSGFHSTPNSPIVMRKNSYIGRYNDHCGSPMGEGLRELNNSTRSLSPPESMTSSSGITDSGIMMESDLMNSMSSMSLQSSMMSSDMHPCHMHHQVDPVTQSAIKLIHQQQVQLMSFLQRVNSGNASGMGSPPCQPHTPLGDGNGNNLERAALVHRNAAGVFDASYTWEGVLPPHSLDKSATYSCKVFLGGVPWDLSEDTLEQVFSPFGPVRVVWPGKDQMVSQPKGFAYLIFESEKKLKALLSNCVKDFANGGSWFYRISSRRMKAKEVEVIPWSIADCNYAQGAMNKLDPQKTVFVGALHGMITAQGLAQIMNDLFDGVLYAGIDTDKYKYPIGSARVTFSNTKSYMKAVAAAFIEIKTDKFSKTIQVDPYLEDSFCSGCKIQQGPYFCREMICFRYFCRTCWLWHHTPENMKNHKPLMRNSKNHPIIGFSSPGTPPSNHF